MPYNDFIHNRQMITNEQILELAKEHLEVLVYDDDETESPTDFAATKGQLIEFAQKIYEIGNENGWESREQVEYFNRPSYPTGLYGDP
jgi:hypothetical protein